MTFIGKKQVAGVSEAWNFAHKQITLSRKNHPKITGASNIVKMESEIYKYFVKYFNTYNQFLGLYIQLVPKKNSHPSCSSSELQLILLQIPHL